MLYVLIGLLSILLGGIIGFVIRFIIAKNRLNSAENRAEIILKEAKLEAESQKKELLLDAKTFLIQERNNFEKETKERRIELQRLEKRLIQKEEQFERRFNDVEKREKLVVDREKEYNEKVNDITKLQSKWQSEIERISGLTSEQAKGILIKGIEEEARKDALVLINKIEEEANRNANRKAKEIIVTTIQRIASEATSDATTTTVSLPNDEMKGRIIGREGRNIRTLETLIGVDIIIDDTPEAVVISSFDPVRREIAKIALNRLITDGRIHPTRIEEVINKVMAEVNEMIYDEGEKAVLNLGIPGISTEGIINIGRLYFRTSYGQNVLHHSIEVAKIAGTLAAELGCDVALAKRGGLLHDIGKGSQSDGDSSHTEAGYDIAKKMGESEKVLNSILSHHGDVEPNCLESILVQAADAISASRPGARRESLDSYIKRLEALEKIAESYEGVEKAFAIQAGREIRVILNNATTTDDKAEGLARDIAKRIEGELKYPGKIKVTVIREARFIEYAR
ncbi:MAG: ribonuclease Y [Spirochaetes bacterium GWD1_27_9]|nr:MAG: ribonuclease Y [Spirochaetes bacterium GWB1_27_13]OHD23924.1 MAG: ribonuclease Y [Spirochaetes bacterium GWC1_27_15]OHD43577.1 MAG: ribonuclease Y [Spirochaetes bacterium GWD1_27_9]